MNENNDIIKDEEKAEETLPIPETEELLENESTESESIESATAESNVEAEEEKPVYAFEWKYTYHALI